MVRRKVPHHVSLLSISSLSPLPASCSKPRPKPRARPTWSISSPEFVKNDHPCGTGQNQERPWDQPSPPQGHGDNLSGGGPPSWPPSVVAPVPQQLVYGLGLLALCPSSHNQFNPHLAFCNESQAGPSSQCPLSRDGHDIIYGPPHGAPSRPPSRPLGHNLHPPSGSLYYGHGIHLPRPEPPSVVGANLLLSTGRITLAQHELVLSCIGEASIIIYARC